VFAYASVVGVEMVGESKKRKKKQNYPTFILVGKNVRNLLSFYGYTSIYAMFNVYIYILYNINICNGGSPPFLCCSSPWGVVPQVFGLKRTVSGWWRSRGIAMRYDFIIYIYTRVPTWEMLENKSNSI